MILVTPQDEVYNIFPQIASHSANIVIQMPGIANLAKILQRCTKMACLTSSRIPIIPLCVSAWIFRKACTRPAALELWFEDWHDMKQQLALVWHLHQCLHGPTRFDTF